MSGEEPIIFLDKVMLHYGDGAPVLKSISASLYKKSFYFLTGASGAGKTTLMRLLYLGIRPSSGQLKIFGKDVSDISRREIFEIRQKIGVVFQDFNLLNHLTVLENVALPLKVMGETEKQRENQAKEILDWVGLGGCFNAYPDVLSGGQKQRVAIARAVIIRPEILLADEPTGNVDEQIASKLMNLFYGMHKMGTCVIVATHYRQFVDTFHYNELKIENGRIIANESSFDPKGDSLA
ncbi:MAG: ATP-binding cassette domain-containing protein [Holosporaceae bacterium]|jgi:cell division transport system ATP-binding protein|nr:ATP-binding cassette domain-containing protein [Holosporaceae bacterium]